MTLPNLCIQRPVMTTLLTLAIVLVGVVGYLFLPVAALPKVDFPTINVTTTLPGASPSTMAASIAAPLEREFAAISGVDTITSVSGLGTGRITIQFNLNRNIDAAAQDVQAAIANASRKLPAEMTTPPTYRKVNPGASAILQITLTSDTLPLTTLNEYAEINIGQRLSTLPGVAQISIFGIQKYAVRVQVDPDLLAMRGIGLDEVQRALAAASSTTPVGGLSGPEKAATLQVDTNLTQASGYVPLIIAYRNGAPVRLGDVAHVIDSVQNDKLVNWYNGKRAITVGIFRQADANTVEVVNRVKELFGTFRAELPGAIDIQVLNDRSAPIEAAVTDMQHTLILTVILVVLVIFLFVRRLSSTIIPALALPVSIIGTFAAMYLGGFSLNNVSLMALTLAVGFVVDDAIVMLENIVRHVEAGLSPMEAALKGSREITFTIISMTVSLVAVFIPVFFMGGVVGRVFNEFAVVIGIAILVSGFVSLTLTPMLCSRFLRASPAHAAANQHAKEGPVARVLERAFRAMLHGYERSLGFVLRHRRATIGLTLMTIGLTGYLFYVIPKGFFPIEDTGFIVGGAEGPEDTSFVGMVERQRKVDQILQASPWVTSYNTEIGPGGTRFGVNSVHLYVSLKPRKERPQITEVIQELRRQVAAVPGINVFLNPAQNLEIGVRPSRSVYQYTLQSGDLEDLYRFAPLIGDEIRRLPGLQDVTSDLQIKSPQAVLKIDRHKAAVLGLTAEQIRTTLYSSFGSRQVATIFTDANDYPVILELGPNFQESEESLSKVFVRSAAGQLIPLATVATVSKAAGPLTVNHQGQMPAVTIFFNLAPGVSLGDAILKIQEAEQKVGLPATVTAGFSGTAQVFQQSLRGQGWLLLAALVVIYIVLGILYESFIHPITILSGLPAAGVGALLTLMLFNMNLSVIAIIGIIMLVGIVKKNAIMMIDFAIDAQRNHGERPERAIFQACLLRFRPIMMTTMAAIMGTLPIALGLGAGAELRQPLGIAVVGGLLTSQLLTLYITPVIYLSLENLRTRAAAKEPSVSLQPAE
ncbi:MAG TPA: efflux RND transporter permease subunit [Xanthobacteraceae bacterium]|nr:efflux RND transporter permease subunit [Xanthobacteraceae bacterium]